MPELVSQRDVMRRLWLNCRCAAECAVRAYAEAERRGEVMRARNASGLDAEGYARALLADGLRKGWLPRCDGAAGA